MDHREPRQPHRDPARRTQADVVAHPTAATRGCTRRTCTQSVQRRCAERLGRHPDPAGPGRSASRRVRCPLTVTSAHRWKMGQIRPGDAVRFVPVPDADADSLRRSDAMRAKDVPAGAGRPRGRRRSSAAPTPATTARRWCTCAAATTTSRRVRSDGPRSRVADAGARTVGGAGGPAGLGADRRHPGVRSLHLHFDRTCCRSIASWGCCRNSRADCPRPTIWSSRAVPCACHSRSTTRRSPRRWPATAAGCGTPHRGCRRTPSSSGGSTDSAASTTSARPCSTRSTWYSDWVTCISVRR